MSSVLDCVKWEIVKVVYFPIVVHVVPWVRIAIKLKSIYNSYCHMYEFCILPAQARTHVDDSPAIFNLFCINNVVGR